MKSQSFLVSIILVASVGPSLGKTGTKPNAISGNLLVGLGLTSAGFDSEIEILDLANPDSSCQNLTPYPQATLSPIGGLDFEARPLICGGHSATTFFSDCFSLEADTWVQSAPLGVARAYSAVAPLTLVDGSSGLIVAGGYTGTEFLDSIEVFTEDGWLDIMFKLPVTVYQHCLVAIDDKTIILIGGIQGTDYSSKTWIYNTVTLEWQEGPSLNQARSRHSCGKVIKDLETLEYQVVVAGGWDGSYLNSVEILDLTKNEWQSGPSLPAEQCCAAMVEDISGGVLLIGGYSKDDIFLNTILHLENSGEGSEWTELEQKLKTGRNYPAAFFVPEQFAICS